MKHIPLKAWALKHFGFAPAPATLSVYAKTKQISPPPVKFAGKWMCEENARFIGCTSINHVSSDNPLVERILHGRQTS
ncbi:excisionase [Vibrio coralliilyticus]|uniref:excisionase n=1 Tax=Vibrio coralliilyticus TaxID=190893 RepID=UPI0017DC5586|nr:excisionase [Vibrio coralliilyticus]NUW66918.1 hypothetical protein [Vibrio coralliilyticus]NUW70888.1 hypothetical protein [Vibrio coralliilyticus]